MSAVDHINEAQKLRVFHMSWEEQPPHVGTVPNNNPEWFANLQHLHNNIHPDVLHAGTRRAALTIHRTHLHEYEVDPDVIDPVVYGDAPYVMDKVNTAKHTWDYKNFRAAMRGKQQGLWETVPGKPRQAIEQNIVLPYRNYQEDMGSISYMIPKSLIEQGKVRHVRVTDVSQDGIRRKLEREEGLYGG